MGFLSSRYGFNFNNHWLRNGCMVGGGGGGGGTWWRCPDLHFSHGWTEWDRHWGAVRLLDLRLPCQHFTRWLLSFSLLGWLVKLSEWEKGEPIPSAAALGRESDLLSFSHCVWRFLILRLRLARVSKDACFTCSNENPHSFHYHYSINRKKGSSHVNIRIYS